MKGAWEMVIRGRQEGERFLRIIREEESVRGFISMRHGGRVPVLINVPAALRTMGFTSDGGRYSRKKQNSCSTDN